MNRMLICLAYLLAACGSRRVDPLPERDASGWTRAGSPRTFDADNLWQYVDGDNERYLQAGVQRTVTAHYRYRDGLEAVADVYEMSAAAGARRIFEAEPAEGSHPIALGDAARHYGQSLTFCQGPNFVRLTVYQEAPQAAGALVVLGKAIAARLGPR